MGRVNKKRWMSRGGKIKGAAKIILKATLRYKWALYKSLEHPLNLIQCPCSLKATK